MWFAFGCEEFLEFCLDGFGDLWVLDVLAFLVDDAVFRGFLLENVSCANGFDVPEVVSYLWEYLVSVVLDVFFFCWCGEYCDEVVCVYAFCFFFGASETVEINGVAGSQK